MEQNNKIERLSMLRKALVECMEESVHDAEEWQVYHDMNEKVKELLHEEYKVQGYSGVYEIKDGQAGKCLYEGSQEACDIFVETLLSRHPEYKSNIIVSPLW